MASVTRDPLLAIARLLILIAQGLMVIAAIALAVGLPLVLFLREEITARIQAQYGDPAMFFPLTDVIGLMILGFAIVALAFLFLRKLRQIVDTVALGDPFVPDNAARLTAMAWLMLGIEALTIPAALLGFNIARVLEETGAEADMSLDFSGIILVVVLFILARVFRKGAEMRTDLEGTV